MTSQSPPQNEDPALTLEQYRRKILAGESVPPGVLAAQVERLRELRGTAQEQSTAKHTKARKASGEDIFAKMKADLGKPSGEKS